MWVSQDNRPSPIAAACRSLTGQVLMATALVLGAAGLVHAADAAAPPADVAHPMHGMHCEQMGHGHAEGEGPFNDHALHAIKASEVQIQEIHKILEGGKAHMRELHEQEAKLHEQLHAVWGDAKLDFDKAEALRQQEVSLHDEFSKAMLKTLFEVGKVLTPEQRTQLQTIERWVHEHHEHGGDGHDWHGHHESGDAASAAQGQAQTGAGQ